MSNAAPLLHRTKIQAALTAFVSQPLAQAAHSLLACLGYGSDKSADLGSTAEELLTSIEQFNPDLGPIDRAKVQADRCLFNSGPTLPN